MTDPRYCGCIARSNNTAALSAVPQILVHCCTLRRQQLGAAREAWHDEGAAARGLPPTTLILRFDCVFIPKHAFTFTDYSQRGATNIAPATAGCIECFLSCTRWQFKAEKPKSGGIPSLSNCLF